MIFRTAIAAAALAALSIPAFSATTDEDVPKAATAAITMDGHTVKIPAKPWYSEEDKKTIWAAQGVQNRSVGLENLDVFMNPDPYIFGAIAGFDLGAPSLFHYSFSTALLPPVTGPVTLKLSIGGSCTDIGGSAGCGISLAPGHTKLAEGSLDGTPVIFGGNPFSTATAGGSASFASTLYTVSLPSMATYNNLGLDLYFTGSGGGDIFSYTMRVDVIPAPIPEPSTYALMLAGMAGIGLSVRRRTLRG